MPIGRIPETLPPPTTDPAAGATQPLLDPASAVPQPPARVGRYQLVRQLAGGGMGVVFEAIQDEPRRSVALKFMRAGIGSSAAMQRFHDEAQVLAQMHHPGIAQIFDAGTHEFQGTAIPYFVMELVPEATPITEYARLHRLSIADRIELMAQVCQAVQYGHDQSIIHRDLKPANIVVDSTGHPRVIDFGIAQTTHSGTSAADTSAGTSRLIGTVPYMSPEQCQAAGGQVDARSDVYSLGVVAFELLCGRLPYDFGTGELEEATRVICQQAPLAPSAACPALRGDLETALLTALSKDKQKRYTTPAGFAADLQRALRLEPLTTRGRGVLDRTRCTLRRLAVHRIWLMGVLAVVLGAAVAQRVAMPVVTRLGPVTQMIDRSISRLTPTAAASPPMQDVRIIQMTEQTDLAGLARAESIDGIDPRVPRSLRRMHGRLMQRLAQARPRVVVFDIAFPGDSEFDTDFAAGALALRDVGCDVIIGSHVWQPDAPGPQRMSSTIASAVRWGGLSAGIGPKAPWRIDLARQEPGTEAQASLALAAVAAWREPGATHLIDLDPTWYALRLRHARWRAGPAGELAVVASETRPFTGIERIDGATVASLMLDVPPDEVLAAATIDYGRVFEMAPPPLQSLVANRLILIGDARAVGGDGPFRHPDGRVLCGFVAQASAIDALLRQRIIRHPSGFEMLSLNLLAAIAGAALGIMFGRGWGVILAMLVGSGAAIVLSVLAYADTQYLFNPLITMTALLVSGAAMAWAARLRARHAFWFTRSMA